MVGRSAVIIKLGGSLTSDRSVFQKPDMRIIRTSCAGLKNLISIDNRQVILLLGGGGFAHPILYEAHSTSSPEVRKRSKQIMCESHVKLRKLFEMELRIQGIEILSLDISDILRYEKGEIILRSEIPSQICSLDNSIIPVITGGILYSSGEDVVTVSSDDIPVYLCDQINLDYFISLTDVEGVRVKQSGNGIVQKVTSSNSTRILELCYENKDKDLTGGMFNKVSNNLDLARKGVRSYIGKAGVKSHDNLYTSVLSSKRKGTYFIPFPLAEMPGS